MSKLVVKIQVLTMEMINRDLAVFIFLHLHHLSLQVLSWQKDCKSHQQLDCMSSKEIEI